MYRLECSLHAHSLGFILSPRETGLFNGGTFWTTANGLEAMIDYCRLVGQPDKCAPYLKNSHAKASKNGFMSKYYDDAG